MSEATSEQQAESTEAADQGNPGEESLGDAGKKALDSMKAKWKDAEKMAATLQAEIDKINQANESAIEKAQREAKEAQEAAQAAGVAALRYRIAAESGITENVDLILTAPDEQTMRRQAELWTARQPDTSTAAGPRPDLTQGGSGQPSALNGDGLESALKSKLGIN